MGLIDATTLDVALVVLGGVAVFLAGMASGLSGFGFGVVGVPILLLLGVPLPIIVPAILLLAIVGRIPLLVGWRSHVAYRAVWLLTLASVPGSFLGAWLAARLPVLVLELVTVVCVLVALVLTYRKPKVVHASPTPLSSGTAGFTGGVLGATTSLNGVPPAIVLLRTSMPALNRSATMALYLVLSNLVALTALVLAGVGSPSAVLATTLWWAVPTTLGTTLGARVARDMDQRTARTATAVLIVLAGVGVLVRAALHA